MFPTALVSIYIRSEGCDDPRKTPGTCGKAYIVVNGKDHSPGNRGHNVVIVDAKTGKEQHFRFCLTYSYQLGNRNFFNNEILNSI